MFRNAKDTGLRNLPLKGFAQNQLWCEIVALACDLLAWTQMLALAGPARRWEPKRLRLRIFAVAGRLVRGGRRLRLRLAEHWPWTREITAAISQLQALRPADQPEPSRQPGRRNHQDPWNPAYPARQPGSQARPGTENSPQPMPQANQPESRKIEVRTLGLALQWQRPEPAVEAGLNCYGSKLDVKDPGRDPLAEVARRHWPLDDARRFPHQCCSAYAAIPRFFRVPRPGPHRHCHTHALSDCTRLRLLSVRVREGPAGGGAMPGERSAAKL
jgi:hypothetical protein